MTPNRRLIGLTLGVALIAASAPAPAPARVVAQDHAVAGRWTIGPIIDGRNFSRGMPLHPTPRAAGGWQVDLPQAPRSLHAITFRHGALTAKRRLILRYRIEADPGVRIVPRTGPGLPSMITLYFQRRGDDWSARGPFEAYRWYASFASHTPVSPGDHVLIAALNGNWTAVQSSSARTNPAAFAAALADADQVGFVLGGGEGLAKGVFATGRARLIVTSFRVE